MTNFTITGSTRLSDLLTAYPGLKEKLPSINERFKMLNTPIGKVMAKKATVSDMSIRSGMDEAFLISRLTSLISS